MHGKRPDPKNVRTWPRTKREDEMVADFSDEIRSHRNRIEKIGEYL